MSMAIEDVLIEVSPGETRAALVDRDGQLIGLQIERMGEESQVGAIPMSTKAVCVAFSIRVTRP